MHPIRILSCVAMLAASTATAEAGFFDTLDKINRVADAAVETQKSLAEGKVPELKSVGGAVGGKHGSSGHHRHK